MTGGLELIEVEVEAEADGAAPRPDREGSARVAAEFSEEELVERARLDPDAFGVLYRRYVGTIHAFAWRR